MNAATLFANNGTKPRTKRPGVWLVRIKPYSPNTGATVQNIRVRKLGTNGVYAEKNGWYARKLSRAEVRTLLNTHVNPHDASSPCVFDVCTFEEAAQLDRAAKVKIKAAGGRRDVADALEDLPERGVFTTHDLPERHMERPASFEDDTDDMIEERREDQDIELDDDAELDDDIDFDDEG